MKKNSYENSNKPDKLTQPAIYPDEKYIGSKAPNPSKENVERSREWSEIVRL